MSVNNALLGCTFVLFRLPFARFIGEFFLQGAKIRVNRSRGIAAWILIDMSVPYKVNNGISTARKRN